MNRVFKSSRTHSEEEATFQGWNLHFTTTTNGNEVANVSVRGNKEGANVDVTINLPQNGANVNFYGCPYDTVLADAIIAEIDLIFGEGVE